MRHVGRSSHQRMAYLILKDIRHALTAGCLMGKDGGGTLIRGAGHFARPHGNAVAHAACHELKPKVSPIGNGKRVKPWLAIEPVEIGTDELAILHANARVIDKIGYAARGVDLIVRTFTGKRLCRYALYTVPHTLHITHT